MPSNYYIGLDLGTSVLKGTAIDESGRIVVSFSKETPLISRKPAWVEQSPEYWWSNTLELIHLVGTKIELKNVQAIGLSGQMHGLVALDGKLAAIRRAIVWLDKRSTKEVEEVLRTIGSLKLYKITGNPVFTGFLLPSLLWIKRNEADIYKKIFKICSPKDYLAYRLTDKIRSEPTDALATSLYDYQKDEWSKTILKAFYIKENLLPDILPTTEAYGGITKKVARLTGLTQDIPVYGGSDQSMAAMGIGLVKEGQAAIAISTGGQFLVIAKKGIIDPKRRLHTLNHAVPNTGLYMAATLSAGLSLRWFKDRASEHQESDYKKFISGIGNIEPGANGLFFLPFLAGERTPYFNPNLKGAFIGLSLNHKRIHLCRAIIEGVSFSMRDCLEVFKQLKIPIKNITLSGGGAKDDIWRQILTDVINIPMKTINIEDHSPFGAAVFAKFASEGFIGLEKFYGKAIQTKDYLYPNEKNAELYEKLFLDYKKTANYLNEIKR